MAAIRYLNFTDEEPNAQRGWIICKRHWINKWLCSIVNTEPCFKCLFYQGGSQTVQPVWESPAGFVRTQIAGFLCLEFQTE